MTYTVHVTEPKDFKALIVRCQTCKTTMTFPLSAEIPVIVQCQGCQAHIDLKAVYSLAGSLKQAKATPYKGFDIAFETSGPD